MNGSQKKQEPIIIKKYANRRLYNTSTSTYVTLDNLADMVKAGADFFVYDAKTSEDITRSVLTQIIFEEENKGTNLLPINFLRQLIRFYDDNMQNFVPAYLEFSLNTLTKEQEKFRDQLKGAWEIDPFKAMDAYAKRNMSLFNDAMSFLNPFTGHANATGPPNDAAVDPASQPQSSELDALRQQLSSMQKQIDKLSDKQ